MFVRLIAAIAILLSAIAARPASAQPRPAGPPPELDVRVGALWPEADSQSRPAFGLRIALRPWSGVASGRLSLQVTGDFRSFGGNDGYDDVFMVRRRITRSRLAAAGTLGVDLVRTPRTTIDVRAGAALLRTRTSFLIDSSQGFVDDDKIWENVCAFQGFKPRCSTDYEATAVVAVGARRTLAPGSIFFVGVDYTGLGIGQHVLMGTFGLELR